MDIVVVLLILVIVLLVILLWRLFLGGEDPEDGDKLVLKMESANKDFSLGIIKEFWEFRSSINEEFNRKFTEIMKENRENEKQLLTSLEKFLQDTNQKIEKNLKDNSNLLVEKVSELNNTTRQSLDNISDRVDKKLEKWFEKTNETFANIIGRLAKIDEAQKNINKLSTEVVSLQSVLTDSKTRWLFGEVQLENILQNVFGEKNDNMYEMQFHFPQNNTLADAVIKTPQWFISIDAKFPLVHYQQMMDKDISSVDKKIMIKKFKDTLKKQINDISSKYIIKDITIDQAFMFIPAEAIFAEINAYYPDIVDYAHQKKISIVSPTTLMAMLTIVVTAIRSIETQKQAKVIQVELAKLSTEFGRFETRWIKFSKDFKAVWKDIDNIDITNQKIIKRFVGIENLELEETEKLWMIDEEKDENIL